MCEAIVEDTNQRIPGWVRKDGFRPILFPPLHVPEVPRWDGPDVYPPHGRKCVPRLRRPIQKRLPGLFRLRVVEPPGQHADLESIIGIHVRLLPPPVVEDMLRVEAHELPNQTPERII